MGHEWWEITTRFQGAGDICPFTNSVSSRVDGRGQDRVIHHSARNIQGIEEWDTAVQQNAQGE